MNGSRQLLPAGAGERDIDTARFLEGSTLLSLQFNVGVQAASPSGKERLPRTSTSVQAAGVEASPNSSGHAPTPKLPGPLSTSALQVQKGDGVGRSNAGSVWWLLSLENPWS